MNSKILISDRVLKEMKIISDQKGILNRYISGAGAWDEHLVKTREFIINLVREENPRSILICGSGWLLDVPLEQLTEITREIYLADIYHPPQIRNKIQKIPGCRLLQVDLTGGAVMAAYNYVREYRKTGIRKHLSDIPLSVPILPVKPGYMISVNMLNQMDILLVDYLKKHLVLEEEEIAGFRARVQQNHLDHLMSSRFCLVTDAEEIIINSQGQEKERRKLIYTHLPEGSRKDSWIWEFDKRGSYNRGMKTHFLVEAVAS